MRFRNSLRLLMENFKQVYKLLSSKLVINLITIALCCSFVLPELTQIVNAEATKTLFADVADFIASFFSADGAALESIKTKILADGGSLENALSLLASMKTELVLTVVGVIVVYLLKRFAETVCHFTVGSVLNDKMSAYAETPFWTAFVANLGKASLYSVVYVPVVFVCDAVMILLVYGIMSLLSVLPALFFSVTAVVFLQALKLSLTSRWLPAMTTDGCGLKKALFCENKAERRQQLKMFSVYLVSVYLVIIVNVLGALATFGSALIITVPMSYFLFICQQYVGYYTVKGRKYFLTFENIASNPDRGDSEHYFDYITEEKTEEALSENENQENKDQD